MGQRMSLPSCVTGGCRVRVRKPCGKYEDVDSPCFAAKVMLKHPEHLVVHCALVDGHVVDISVISPEQHLLPGVPYMLYPKVESTGVPGCETSNIPASMCLSVEKRLLTFRSSHSPDAVSKEGSSRNAGKKGSSKDGSL